MKRTLATLILTMSVFVGVEPLPGGSGGARRGSLAPSGTRVFVSRREVRVVFPRDTAREWGWSERQDRDYVPSYAWGISIEGIDGPRSLSLNIGRVYGKPLSRRFQSLTELVAAAHATVCKPGMFADCTRNGVSASVRDRHVVLTLRDSALIARLVGLRPAWASVWHTRPDVPYVFRADSARIEYVDPQVPKPDSALRAEAAVAGRRYQASVNSIRRYIVAEGGEADFVWMAVGDSVRFSVMETRCHFDVCSSSDLPARDSGWMVGDSSVVRLRPAAGGRRWLNGPSVSVIAKRIGRTSVRVRGLSGAGDTLPSREPVATDLEVQVVVTLPVARVEFVRRETRAVAGQSVGFRARAIDTRGRVIAGAPIQVLVEGGEHGRATRASHLIHFPFDSPGRYTVTASFGGRADTLMVDVAPAPGAPPSDPGTVLEPDGLSSRPGARPNARSAPKGWEAVVADLAAKHADELEQRVRDLRRLLKELRG